MIFRLFVKTDICREIDYSKDRLFKKFALKIYLDLRPFQRKRVLERRFLVAWWLSMYEVSNKIRDGYIYKRKTLSRYTTWVSLRQLLSTAFFKNGPCTPWRTFNCMLLAFTFEKVPFSSKWLSRKPIKSVKNIKEAFLILWLRSYH